MGGRISALLSALVLSVGVLLSVASISAAGSASCANEAERLAPSASLPDCRAYELVSPPNSNGRRLEIPSTFTFFGELYDRFPEELASQSKDSFMFMAYAGSLAVPSGGNGTFDTYRSQRTSTGWEATERLSLPKTSPTENPHPGGISADHSYSFQNREGIDYLRGADGTLELTGLGDLADEPYVQGRYISAGGSHVIFTSGHFEANSPLSQNGWCNGCPIHQLEANAPPGGTGAVYDRPADGPTHVVSLLPGNVPPAAGEEARYRGTSKDANSVTFTVGSSLYVRIHNGEALSEETLKVAEGNPTYAGLSADGKYVFYTSGGTIHRFDTADSADTAVNPIGEAQVVNISADGSHVYFIADQQLDGSKGTSGLPNIYVWAEAPPKFIATVAASDLDRTSGVLTGTPALANWTHWVANHPEGGVQGPGNSPTRSTPGGRVLVFESRAQLTSYDNAGHTEIYRYEDTDSGPSCVSCNPEAATATADARLQELHVIHAPIMINNLSEDGRRVFFETTEALVENDTDGINDIYEWQEEGLLHSLNLISSGISPAYPFPEVNGNSTEPDDASSPRPNVLLGITPDGSDVFFSANQPLVPGAGENGTQGIYDARIGGGFSASAATAPCSEEGCKASVVGQVGSSVQPPSEGLSGGGNVKPRKHGCRLSKKGSGGKTVHHCGKPHHHKKHPAAARSSVAAGRPGTRSESSAVPAGSGMSPAETAEAPSQRAGNPVAQDSGAGEQFGIERLEIDSTTPEAGAHPDVRVVLSVNHSEKGGVKDANATTENVSVKLPPGLLGNPRAIPACSMGEFSAGGNCPPDSQVGITRVDIGDPLHNFAVEPVYNLSPPHPDREVARLGFYATYFPVFIDLTVRTAGDYGVTANIHDAPGPGVLISSETTVWGDPAGESHDPERLTHAEAAACPICGNVWNPELGGARPSGIPEDQQKGFLTNPAACQEGHSVTVEATAYQLPGQLFTASAPFAPITNCTGLPFAPSFEAEPTSHEAGAPTGLKTKLVLPQHLGSDERVTATMREARVTLPAGMQVAAGAANWIGTCSDQQVGFHEEVDTACPDNAKLGTAKIVSPALSVPIAGTIYQRSPQPGHQLGLWLTSDALGLHVKLPGELEPDKQTGRLTAVFKDLPQVPVEEIDLVVWGGPRAPLQNPDRCGTFATDFSFSPHSDDPTATGQSTMQITEGCNQGFSPTLKAGVTEPVAGKFSPFVFDLTRPDADQALRGFELHLPDGELAKIKGVPLCPDAAAAAGVCPAGSRIGSIQATTGPGPDPLTIPQPGKAQPQIYFAGPYQGAPFSIVSEVPAQAGPFDLGVLAVRSGLQVEPETGRAVVKADPLPQFFEGVGIAYRNLRAVVDRPEFSLNPTDCRETAVTSDVTSTQGAVAHPSARFQVDGCKRLKFKPRLSLSLKGGTKRADYPAFTAVLRAREGDANIAFASVALPHSEFLAQEHIGTICTRKRFAADRCPKGSVYGKAKAFTPLLDKPLSGPVYLRSSNHPLPDLVAKLGGQLEIDLVGRIDSVHGGIRTTFESVPDAPVSRFVLQMKGGAKSLLTNSTDICRRAHRATVRMRAQNGRAASLRPPLQSSACAKKKLGKHKKHHH